MTPVSAGDLLIRPDRPIARGRTAEIYAVEDALVLKLFRPQWSRAAAQREFDTAARVSASGAPTPAARGLLEVHGRPGIVYERIHGPSMLDVIRRRPWTAARHARAMADLQARLSRLKVADIPRQKARLERRIRSAALLSETQRSAVLRLLDGLHHGDSLCHGDFHPGNILIADTGPMVIDWADATTGNPLGDVARTCLLLTNGPLHVPAGMRRLLIRLPGGRFRRAYMSRYLELTGASASSVKAWTAVIAAARLDENISVEQQRLLATVAALTGR